jgi:GT2 family glycosyltransferase/glycosyltransferase involved in cell wall biosynthesis
MAIERLPDFVILAQERWDEVERRNQLLIRALAERHPRTRFLFCEQPLRPRELKRWRPPRPKRVGPSIWAMQPLRPLPDSVSEAMADRVEAAQIRRAARAVALERPWLWSQDPRAATLHGLLPVEGLIYDLTDDWVAFEEDPVRRAEVERRVTSLVRQADLALACSRPLEATARAVTDRVVYLPNAVEELGEETEVPPDLASLTRPRLGYAGTLHSARIDVELLEKAAAARPRWSFVFLGPNLLETSESERLFSLPNVKHLGVRPHPQVRSYLTGFDVCLLPNRVTDFTRSLDPLKLYEYLAAGRPIITTPVDNAPELADHLTVVESADELVLEAERLLGEDDEAQRAARRASVGGETWAARAERLEQELGLKPRPDVPGGVSVVIVSFNTKDLTRRCLETVQGQGAHVLEAIVVDNASSDGSAEMIRAKFPEVQLVVSGRNLGFGPANNLAFRACRGEFVLLLNSDAFLEESAIAKLLETMQRHPGAGAVGPRLLNEDGSLQRSAWPFPSASRLLLEATGLHRPLRRMGLLEDLGQWNHDEEREVDFLIGACLLVRREALAEIGGFDEAFWLYAEEADLQRRLHDRGWRTVFTPSATAVHLGSASSAESGARWRRFFDAQALYVHKHGPPGASLVARLAMFIGAVARRRWGAAAAALHTGRPGSD